MAAKDIYHDHVRRALENDGWTITHDPFSVKWLGRTLQEEQIRLIVFDAVQEEVIVWIS